MTTTVRLARPQDLHALVGFNRALAHETEGLSLDVERLTEGVRHLLADDRYGFYTVAERDGEVIGSLMITYEWSDWRNGLIWWIQSVYVLPDHRRQGVFSELYANARRLANRAGEVRALRLYVEKENRSAQKTYQDLGMNETHYRLFEAESP